MNENVIGLHPYDTPDIGRLLQAFERAKRTRNPETVYLQHLADYRGCENVYAIHVDRLTDRCYCLTVDGRKWVLHRPGSSVQIDDPEPSPSGGALTVSGGRGIVDMEGAKIHHDPDACFSVWWNPS